MKSLLILFLVLSSVFSYGVDFETRLLLDKTFVHDNTYCKFQKKKLEIELRSFDKYTSPEDALYGDHIIFIQDKKQVHIPVSHSKSGRYKLLPGTAGKICSKSLALKIDEDNFAFFFLKDNRPLGHSLTVVLYNLKTKDNVVVDTPHSIRDYHVKDQKFFFSASENYLAPEIGKIKIEDEDYTFIQKKLEVWHSYDGKVFLPDPEMTQEKFSFAHILKDSGSVKEVFLWDQKAKRFQAESFFYATNRQNKKECIGMIPVSTGEKPLTNWICSK